MRFLLLIVPLACYGQVLPYFGMGTSCSGPGFAVRNLGEYISINKTDAEKAIKAGCQIIPEDDYVAIGFTSAEIRAYPRAELWPSAPDSFNVKVTALLAAYGEYRNRLLNGNDSMPPVISNVLATVSSDSVAVTWLTNELARMESFEYGIGNFSSILPPGTNTTTTHALSIPSLAPGTYQYQLKVKDSSGNLAFAGPFSFQILEPPPPPASGYTFADAEVPQGAVDGLNASFRLSQAPNPAASLKLYRNGVRLKLGDDYSLSGGSITFKFTPPQAGDTLLADYRY